MYLNLIIGLAYKWYDQEKIDAFFNQLGGKNQELYEGLLWIGLENTLYPKEEKIRSALRDIRKEYARESLRRYRKYKEYSRIDQIRNGHCREILGQSSGLKEEDEQILHAFSFSEDMSTDRNSGNRQEKICGNILLIVRLKEERKLFSAEGIRSISVFWKSKCYLCTCQKL